MSAEIHVGVEEPFVPEFKARPRIARGARAGSWLCPLHFALVRFSQPNQTLRFHRETSMSSTETGPAAEPEDRKTSTRSARSQPES